MITEERRRTHRATVLRVAAHEFNRSLRVWKKFLPVDLILERLINERGRALKIFIQLMTFSTLGAIWLNLSIDSINIDMPIIKEIRVPLFIVNSVISFSFLLASIQIINYSILESYVRVCSNNAFRFDNAAVLQTIFDGSGAWVIGIAMQYRFFKFTRWHDVVGVFLVFVISSPLVIIVIFDWISISISALQAIGRNTGYTEKIFSLMALMAASIPIVLTVFILIPFRIEKNKMFIRWTFVSGIYRRQGILPYRIGAWLNEKAP